MAFLFILVSSECLKKACISADFASAGFLCLSVLLVGPIECFFGFLSHFFAAA